MFGLHSVYLFYFFFFFNDTATTEIYTLSLHDALPISPSACVPCLLPVPATSDRQSAVRPERQRERRIGKKMLFPEAFQPAGRRMTPSNVSPVVTKRQSAISSLRARACPCGGRGRRSSSCACRHGYRQCGPGTTVPVRSASETAESARRVGSCRGGPGHCRLWRRLVPAASHRSRPASPSDRRST